MPEQYVAADKRTGVEVAVTGTFPPHPDDRIRIARTTTLFTRLMSTLLEMEESDRRTGFRAVETQLELADALIRQDMDDVRRLVRETMQRMGVTQEQLDQMARQLHELSGLDPATADELGRALGLTPEGRGPDASSEGPAAGPAPPDPPGDSGDSGSGDEPPSPDAPPARADPDDPADPPPDPPDAPSPGS